MIVGEGEKMPGAIIQPNFEHVKFWFNENNIQFVDNLVCFIPKYDYLNALTKQSIPVMFSMLFIGVGIFNILYFIGKFGDLATAGYGAALRVEQVFLLPVIGLNTAVLSIGAQNFGAKKFDRVRVRYSLEQLNERKFFFRNIYSTFISQLFK